MVETGGGREGDRSRRYLLDTNVVIAALEEDPAVVAAIETTEPEPLLVPATVLGELYFGTRKSARVSENTHRIESFASGAEMLPCNGDTARFYAEIKDALRRKGRPIPENDIWIAAVALQHDLVLASRDSHFEHVEGLQLDRW